MSFPRYPKYKASGVEWLGDVPAHWEVTRLGYLCVKIGSGKTPSGGAEAYGTDGVLFVRSQNVLDDGLSLEDAVFISAETDREMAGSRVLVGDLLLNITGASLGRSCLVQGLPTAANVNQHVCIVRLANADLRGYVSAALQSLNVKSQFDHAQNGAAREGLNFQQVGGIVVPLPPPEEALAIAAFLGRETAKIDALVAEQQRLIELLQEKRQAVISHAVTKGLDPNARMKPSGIDWLGDVPAHWAVRPLKAVVSVPITDGPHETPEFREQGVPFISAEAVSSGRIDFTKARACISPEDNARYSLKYAPRLHDIYMVKSGATTGITAMVEDRTDFNIWSPLAAIRCGDLALPTFVLNFMRSRNFLEAVTLAWSFGTQQNIGMSVIENLACTVPPVVEQAHIAACLARETGAIDAMVIEAERATTLLQERRAALVSAAVTGQIDVRNHVASA